MSNISVIILAGLCVKCLHKVGFRKPMLSELLKAYPKE